MTFSEDSGYLDAGKLDLMHLDMTGAVSSRYFARILRRIERTRM